MKVRITDTQNQQILNLIDPKSGVNWIADFIGNTGSFGAGEGQFRYDDESGEYLCDQDTYDWWQNVVAQQQAVDDRIHELRAEHGSDAVEAVIQSVGDADLEDVPSLLNAALDEAFGSAD